LVLNPIITGVPDGFSIIIFCFLQDRGYKSLFFKYYFNCAYGLGLIIGVWNRRKLQNPQLRKENRNRKLQYSSVPLLESVA